MAMSDLEYYENFSKLLSEMDYTEFSVTVFSIFSILIEKKNR